MAWHSKLVTLISFTEAKRCREKLLCCIRRYVKHYMGYQIWSKYAVTSSFEYFPLIFNCSPNRDKTEIQNDVSSLHCYAIALVWNESENSVTAKTTGWRLALHFCFVPFFIFTLYTLNGWFFSLRCVMKLQRVPWKMLAILNRIWTCDRAMLLRYYNRLSQPLNSQDLIVNSLL